MHVILFQQPFGNRGSARTKPSWLEDHFSWRDAFGTPVKPDWSALQGAKVVADLVKWSYRHSESQNEALDSQVSEAMFNVWICSFPASSLAS